MHDTKMLTLSKHACYAKLQMNDKNQTKSESIREYVRKNYLEPARKKGEKRVRVVAGEVHKALGLRNRIPLVCNALRSKDLLATARVRILSDDGPPSGQSSTVALTYEILVEKPGDHAIEGSKREVFLKLRGIARNTFKELGGGEPFIRRERERFSSTDTE